jgi:hypothetical protein
MNKRKSLSLDVMQQFMKDPSTVDRSSNAEVDADISTDVDTEINAEASDDLLAAISTDVDDDLLADVSADVDDDELLALVSADVVEDDLLADISTEITTDVSTQADRTRQSDNPRPQPQVKAKSSNPKPEKTKPKRGSNAAKAEESSLSVDVIEAFKIAQKEATTRFTVDLPQSQHQQFAIVSKKLNTNMSTLARVLIEKFLTEIERDGLL